MTIIKFVDVGRNRASWTLTTALGADAYDRIEKLVVREVKKRKCLRSREVGASMETKTLGIIYAGMRRAGRFIVEAS